MKYRILNHPLKTSSGLLMLFLGGTLLSCTQSGKTQSTITSDLEDPREEAIITVIREEWHGTYLGDRKIGYAYQRVWSEQEPERKTFRSRSRLVIPSQNFLMTGEAILNPDFTIREFSWQAETGRRVTITEGKLENGTLSVSVYSGGAMTQREFALSHSLASEESAGYLLSQQGFQPGSEIAVNVYSPELGTVVPLTARVIGPEDWTAPSGEVKRVHRVESRLMGVKIVSWVNDQGSCLESRTEILGVRTLREDRKSTEDSQDFAKLRQSEIIWESSVDPGTRIENPMTLEFLHLILGGVPETLSIPSDRHQQVLRREEDRVWLRVGVDPRAGTVLPEEVAEALESSLLVQSEHPAIRDHATKVVGPETDREKQVRLLINWVGRNVRVDPERFLIIPSAAEILESRKGDCNEQATLFAALARSIRIPTRIVAGLVYFEGRFGYHAWNEVLLETPEPHWRSVDTTRFQFPVDVTHIKLGQGDVEYPLQIASLVGRLSIRIGQDGE